MHRKVKLRIAVSTLFMLVAGSAFSQKTFNVAGNSATINGNRFDYSIGEMTLVTTERSANLIVTQGLLQPTGSGSGASSEPVTIKPSFSDNVKVYPNPTSNLLYVETIEPSDVEVGYQMYDATGKMIFSKSVSQKAGPHKQSFDLQSYAAGSYYLLISKPSAAGALESFSYKIQKTN